MSDAQPISRALARQYPRASYGVTPCYDTWNGYGCTLPAPHVREGQRLHVAWGTEQPMAAWWHEAASGQELLRGDSADDAVPQLAWRRTLGQLLDYTRQVAHTRPGPMQRRDTAREVCEVLAAAWQLQPEQVWALYVAQRMADSEDRVREALAAPPQLAGPYDGDTYDAERDLARLSKQHELVYLAMRHGHWRTLGELATVTGQPEASVSARLRDFRKPRYGRHQVERRHVAAGLWQYRLVWNDNVPKPQLRLVPDRGGGDDGERGDD